MLHTFTALPGPVQPIGGLVMNAKGILYGTASQGGPYGWGAVFKIKP